MIECTETEIVGDVNMKNIKKVIAVLLSVLMALSVMPIAFAETISFSQNCPYIFIHGYAANTIYDDPSDPDSRMLFPPSTENIIKAVENAAPALCAYLINEDGKMLADAVVPLVQELFGNFGLDRDGNPIGNSGIRYKEVPSLITAESKLDFEYDWRLDPIEIASQLNDFINMVCEKSGCDKVAIMAHSFGGVVAISYAAIYGTDKIQGIVMNSTAIRGETYTGELMTNEFKLSVEGIEAYLRYALNENDYNELINGIVSLLADKGLLDFVKEFADKIIADAYDEVMGRAVFPMFAYMPSIWAMIPDEYMQSSLDFVFNGRFAEKGYDYTALKGKINTYNTVVRANREDILTSLEKNGHFGVYVRYGFSSIPITPSWESLSDGVIDAKYASYGATTAEYGKILSPEYLEGKDKKYISPDKTLDASTCMFPEKTWFVKNFGHTASQLLPALTMAILYADKEVTVDTYEDYPRFIIYNSDETFTPQTEDDTLSPIERAVLFFKQLIRLIKTLFSKIFS